MSGIENEGDVILLCGNCGRSKRVGAEYWKEWEEKRRRYGTVMLCDRPSTIPGSKAKCLGVIGEAPKGYKES
ncbi:MAG TPA: hypothetical protein VF133_17685 [Terriglobales bacterium]